MNNFSKCKQHHTKVFRSTFAPYVYWHVPSSTVHAASQKGCKGSSQWKHMADAILCFQDLFTHGIPNFPCLPGLMTIMHMCRIWLPLQSLQTRSVLSPLAFTLTMFCSVQQATIIWAELATLVTRSVIVSIIEPWTYQMHVPPPSWNHWPWYWSPFFQGHVCWAMDAPCQVWVCGVPLNNSWHRHTIHKYHFWGINSLLPLQVQAWSPLHPGIMNLFHAPHIRINESASVVHPALQNNGLVCSSQTQLSLVAGKLWGNEWHWWSPHILGTPSMATSSTDCLLYEEVLPFVCYLLISTGDPLVLM